MKQLASKNIGKSSETVLKTEQSPAEIKTIRCCYISPVGEQYDTVFNDCIMKGLREFTPIIDRITYSSLTNSFAAVVDGYDFCFLDISRIDPFVYIILGICIKSGKQNFLMSSSSSYQVPYFLEGLVTYIPYRWRDFDLAIVSISAKLSDKAVSVSPITVSSPSPTKASFHETENSYIVLNERIDKLESRVSEIEAKLSSTTSTTTITDDIPNQDPKTALQSALFSRDVEKAEKAMDQLEKTLTKLKYLDFAVEQVALIGSVRAGNLLLENMQYFLTSKMSIWKKEEYLGVLITFLNQNDMEEDNLTPISTCCRNITNSDGDVPDGVLNQLSRLYYGAYGSTGNYEYLDIASEYIQQAIEMDSSNTSYLYNLSKNLKAKATQQTLSAEERDQFLADSYAAIVKCMEISEKLGKYDDDHLKSAVLAYKSQNDPKWIDLFTRLYSNNPIQAEMLKKQEHLVL